MACLAARFSFRDFPDFLVMVCRGDLSDIAGALIMGVLVGPDSFDLTPLGPGLWAARCTGSRDIVMTSGLYLHGGSPLVAVAENPDITRAI